MTSVVLLLCGLLGAAPEPTAKAEDLAAYDAAKVKVGRDAEAHVKLALWCESHGLKAERVKHLALAVLADPKNVAARGLMGLVAYAGRWANPDEVSRKVHDDPARAAAVKEYVQRRAITPNKAEAQWELALWCGRNGLKVEESAHLRAVVRLEPGREAAWKRLGYRKEKGRWVSDEQLAADRAEAHAQRQADHKWRPLLEKAWAHRNDRSPERREEAQATLASIHDSRAVPVVWSIFGRGDSARQAEAVNILSRIDGPAASRALAVLAVFGRDAEVRRASSETLPRRDAREFADLLVALLRDPVKYEVKPVAGPGIAGELLVKGTAANVKRLYTPPVAPVQLQPGDVLGSDEQGLPTLIRALAPIRYAERVVQQDGRRPSHFMRFTTIPRNEVIPAGRMANEAQYAALTTEAQLEGDVEAIDQHNAPIKETNARATALLARIAGRDLGDNRQAWQAWATDLQGYAFVPQKTSQETSTVVEQVPISFQPQSYVPVIENGLTMTTFGHASCFAAGTPVRTLDGLRPIEKIEAGDQVLAQDTKTGALSYQAVVTAFHNPPNATLRVRLGDESIVATGIHRFWKAGSGWIMARELKPGDSLRTLGGVSTVSSVEDEPIQPVFNLEIANGQSFFVGNQGALVHDNSLVVPVSEPFDAPGK